MDDEQQHLNVNNNNTVIWVEWISQEIELEEVPLGRDEVFDTRSRKRFRFQGKNMREDTHESLS